MFNSSGIGTYLKNIVPQIIELCPEFDFTLLGNISELKNYTWTKDKNVNIVQFDAPIYSIAEQIKYKNVIPNNCDLFWMPHYNIPLFLSSQKILVTIHDLNHMVFFSCLSPKYHYARTMINAAVKKSVHILTISNFTKSELIKYTNIDGNKIFVHSHGIDKNYFKPIRNIEILKEIKFKYSLPNKFILYVGNIKPHKNLKILMRAYKDLLIDNDDCKLVIVGKKTGFITGDKKLFKEINNSSGLKNNVVFTGFVDENDLPCVYSLAELFVFPSLYEGYGYPPLEAMACGCPALVSKCASIPESCGDGALYFDPKKPDDLKESIIKILNNKKLIEKMKKRGLQRASEHSWATASKEIVSKFHDIFYPESTVKKIYHTL